MKHENIRVYTIIIPSAQYTQSGSQKEHWYQQLHGFHVSNVHSADTQPAVKMYKKSANQGTVCDRLIFN